MDARRFDRNADQLAQIFWHISRQTITIDDNVNELWTRYAELIEEALRINDELGKMAEKGLV